MKMIEFKNTGFRAGGVLKKVFNSIIVILFVVRTVTAYALPQVGDVVSGDADVEIDGNTMTITASDGTVIDYTSFNIGQNESVIIILPSSTSQILNNVIGGEASNLMGYLSCNGLFILINPAGIHVGPAATLDVASMIMSTRMLAVEDFLDKEYIFKKLSDEEKDMLLLNEGTINIQDGGFGVLIAGAIENNGKIVARLGTVALATGDAVSLDISDDGLISIAIDEAVAQEVLDFAGNPITDQIKNSGGIEADGGYVVMKAESITDLFNNAINLDGYVVANKLDGKEGRIELVASDDIYSTGILEAKEGAIYLESDGDITSYGTIETESLIERGASFRVGGIFHVGLADVCNLDNAITIGGGGGYTHVSGTITDPGNIIIDDQVYLDDNTTFITDSDMDGSGAFIMNIGSLITSGGSNLSIYASEDSTLREITNINGLSVYSNIGFSPTYTAYNDLTLHNFVKGVGSGFIAPANMTIAESCNILSGNFTAPSGLLSVGSFNVTPAASFTHNSGTVVINVPEGENYYDFGGITFYNLTLKGWGDMEEARAYVTSDVTVDNDLALETGTAEGPFGIYSDADRNITIGGDLTVDGMYIMVNGTDTGVLTFDLAGDTSSFFLGFHSIFGADSALKFSGSGTQAYAQEGMFDGSLEVDKNSGVVELQSNLYITGSAGSLNINSGVLYTKGHDMTIDTGAFSNEGTLRLQGNEGLDFEKDTNSGTVEYVGGTGYNSLNYGEGYHNLVFNSTSGNDTWTAYIDGITANTLTITSGTLDLGGFDLRLTGTPGSNFSNKGTLRLLGTENLNAGNPFVNDADSGTIEYYGNETYSQLTAGSDYYNLTFSGSGTYTHTEDIDVNNNLTIEGGTFTAPANVTIGGDFKIDGGAFDHNNGTVIFDDATKISHIYGTTFYNLKSETAGKEIRFSTDSTKTVEGDLTLTGTADNRIKLRSTDEGTEWSIDPKGDINISGVDVKDSNNLSGDAIDPPDSIDSGNNTNWFTADTTDDPEDPDDPDDPVDPVDPDPDVPLPPDPPEIPQIDDDIDEVEIEMEGKGFDYDIVYEEGNRFKKPYKQGRYRTTIIVREGCVVATPYDEEGADYEKGAVLTAGQKTSQEGEVE